jgi:hypothetical protein
LIINQIRNPDRRKDILTLLVNFCKTDVAHEQFVTNFSNALENEGIKAQVSNSISLSN